MRVDDPVISAVRPNPSALGAAGVEEAVLMVAVSGGLDSMVLLRALQQAGWSRLIVAHVDHGLRGAASQADAEWVKTQAAAADLPSVTATLDPTASSTEAVGSEGWARCERRDALASMAQESGATALVMAHHADDQAETVLMALARGAGLRGLGGMRSWSSLPLPSGATLPLWRPLLHLSRADLHAWARQNNVLWREDATNAQTHFTRNRVRHQLFPEWRQALNRDPVAMLSRVGALCQREDELLHQLAASALERLAQPQGLQLRLFRTEPEALQWRVLRLWVHAVSGHAPTYELTERLMAMTPPGSTIARINLSQNRWIRRSQGYLWLQSGC